MASALLLALGLGCLLCLCPLSGVALRKQTVDFGHTAQLGLELPVGFLFRSESGVFLTQAPPNAVPYPEPNHPVSHWSGRPIAADFSLCRQHRPCVTSIQPSC